MEMPRLGIRGRAGGCFLPSRMLACTRCIMMHRKSCDMLSTNRFGRVSRQSSGLLLSYALLISPPLFAHGCEGLMMP